MENDLMFLRPWAIKTTVLHSLTDSFARRETGDIETGSKLEAASFASKRNIQPATAQIVDGIARIPIYGIIEKRSGPIRFLMPVSSSVQEITAVFRSALNDTSVKKIILDIDSPGGQVDAIAELSDFIFSSRKKKPIVAYSDGQMLSAAYWIGTAASKVYATKGAEIGSIGVYSIIRDLSVREHNEGVRSNLIKAGEYKATGHPSVPLTDDGRSEIQRLVDTFYSLFVDAVARNRGFKMDRAVKLADGRAHIAGKALALGLIDGVQALESFTSEAVALDENIPLASLKTPADLKTQIPSLASRVETDTRVQLHAELTVEYEKKLSAAVANERNRVLSLFRLAYSDQRILLRDLIESGATAEQARAQFDEAATLEQHAEREWRTTLALRQEFTTVETYVAYKKAEKAGRVRVFRG
jgi:signal peptide peptidase SppA